MIAIFFKLIKNKANNGKNFSGDKSENSGNSAHKTGMFGYYELPNKKKRDAIPNAKFYR